MHNTIKYMGVDQRTAYFKLIATITIERNRPLLKNKGLKHRRYAQTVLKGNKTIWNKAFEVKIYRQTEKLVKMFPD